MVSPHSGEQRTGAIERLDVAEGSGIIRDRRDEGLTWRFDATGVLGQGFGVLRAGDAVEFTLEEGPDGLRAARVARIIATHEPLLEAPPPDAGPPPELEDAPE